MANDAVKNFAKVTVSTGYDAAATSIVLSVGGGAKLPATSFNAVWWNATDYADPSDDPNVEIVRVTVISTDTLTVTRGQESTSAATHNTAGKTYKMIGAFTKKTYDDIFTNGSFTTPTITTPTVRAWDGWQDANESWAYASVDGPTGVITVPSDATTKYSVGMRIKLTQTTVKYFIVTAVTSTTLTVYGGTDYTLANAAISANYYSLAKAPFGFNIDPAKWSVVVSDTSNRVQATPTASTWYNNNSALQITIPIGIWDFYFQAIVEENEAGGQTNWSIKATLSTANNSESDSLNTAFFRLIEASLTNGTLDWHVNHRFPINLSTKTLYYFNVLTLATGAGELDVRGDVSATKLVALCALL